MKNIYTLFVCLFVCLTPVNAMKKNTADLSGQGLTDLTGVEFSENISRVILKDNELTSFETANFPASLRSIIADNNNINQLTNIPESVSFLSINSNALTNLNDLPANLNFLIVRDNLLTSIQGVANSQGLINLDLDDNQLTDISAIQNLNSLEQFSFINNNVIDINFNWPQSLRFVNLSNNSIEDISPLAKVVQLKDISAFGGSIASLPDLSALNDLRDISISGHPITELNCSFLPDSLREIFLLDNDIANVINPCELNMPKLKNLILASNNLTEINMTLNRAKKLKKIDLSSNDLTSLANLTIKPRRKTFTLDVRDNGNLPQSEIKAFKQRHPNARVKSGGFF